MATMSWDTAADASLDAKGSAIFKAPLQRRGGQGSVGSWEERRPIRQCSRSSGNNQWAPWPHIMYRASETASVMAASASALFFPGAAAAARAAASGAWKIPVQAERHREKEAREAGLCEQVVE